MALMLRWRMPSRTDGLRNVRAVARRAAVCRDMRVTRNLGLGAMGRGISKIRVRRRTTWTGRRGEVGAGGCGVGVVGVEGKARVVVVGRASRVVWRRGVDDNCSQRSRVAIIDSELEDPSSQLLPRLLPVLSEYKL